MRGSSDRIAVVLPALALACASPVPEGHWLGDARPGPGVERLDVQVDPGGAAARITLAAWHLDAVRLARTPPAGDGPSFTGVVDGESVGLAGAVDAGRWIGVLTRGSEAAPFELLRLHDLTDAEQRGMVGSYRSGDGRLFGIAPFTEFGSQPMLVDYATGRIGPLHAVARDRFLIGKALVAPLLPADPLDLTRRSDGVVTSIRVAERGRPPVVASRIETRDEEVRLRSGPITLGGTLTLPEGPPPHPALVLVHGSNAQTRDALGPWSRFFAGLGYAVLGYDKRGTGASTGDWRQADFRALADDAIAGVRHLAARPDIRADRVGLWGISQGGWIVPIVAAEAPREIAFAVVHAGSGTTVREEGILYLRNELRAAGLPDASVALGERYQELDDRVTASGAGWEELQRFYEMHSREEPWLWPPRPADDWFRAYYRMLMDFDPSPYWSRVTCPALLFFGELDANVPPAQSWPPIERALAAGGNSRVTQIVLPRANHAFLEAGTGGRDEYAGLSHFVPGYFDRMAAWLAPWAK